jgi:GNAT superfamily N-acetyltransferase
MIDDQLPDILQLYDLHQRRAIDFPGMRKEVLPHVTRFIFSGDHGSIVLHSHLDAANVDAVIEEQIADFSQLNLPFEWKVYDHDTPPDLRARLLARGFEADDVEAIMVLDLAATPPALLKPVTADVRRTSQRSQLDDVVQVESQVWDRDLSRLRPRLGDHLDLPGYLSVYVAYVDNQPASAAWIYFHPHSPFADLWGGATLSDFRRLGLYTALLAVRVQEAIQRGYRYLTIDASAMSRPIVARHGFRLLTFAHACNYHPK